MNEHEFLNADKSNLALQTQYFTDSLKNFNDIAVHSKMMLELIAKRILGQPKVIPTVYLTDGDFSPPVDEVVAIRAMVMSTQTTPVVITVNGIIPMLVSTVPTQIVTGPISSVTVGNTVPGNPVYVQYLDERAALLSNTSTQDDVAVNGTVSLTGSLAPLPPVIVTPVFSQTFASTNTDTSFRTPPITTHPCRARVLMIQNYDTALTASCKFNPVDTTNFANPGVYTANATISVPSAQVGVAVDSAASGQAWIDDPMLVIQGAVSYSSAPVAGRMTIVMYEQP